MKFRPVISEELWRLFIEYNSFIGRNVQLLKTGKDSSNIIDWRKDKLLVNNLNPFLNDSEKTEIYNAKTNAFGLALEKLENKILLEISKATTEDKT